MLERLRAKYGTFRPGASAASTASLDESIACLEAQLLRLRCERGRRLLDRRAERDFAWEERASPWMLLFRALQRVGQSVAALVLLYWSMGTNEEFLMRCDGRKLSSGALYCCEYTKSFLRCFTLLGVNVALGCAMRMIIRERIYYGMLKAGGLLDFADAQPLRDPVLWFVGISLLHGLSHFGLKFSHSSAWATETWWDDLQELKRATRIFLMPACIFLGLVYATLDVEANLVPLNKYFEEDWEYAKCALGSIVPMKESVLREGLEVRDIVAEVREPTIRSVYARIVECYREFSAPTKAGPWFGDIWPVRLLLDPRLRDTESRSFLRMFATFLALCSVVCAVTLAALFKHAAKDLLVDFWAKKQSEDGLAFAVELVHILLIGACAWASLQGARASRWSARRGRGAGEASP
mmetsp:Transcript_28533/g.90956  ORF Transcript_28533/g.90956 Transcript_28533/m.90956 type:complete len:409 (+) Transcript_28533:195-1421(+)